MFPQIFGKYVLERELASGGMARVFLATLRGAGGFEKRLVVKQIRPELASDQSFIQRFVAEAKTTVELSHANIVPVYELGAEQGVYYIAMELCTGVSLAELLRDGPTSPSEGAYIGVEICRALDYAHRKAGVVHRDVTPRNVMIDAEGMVKVIDFGIAAPASGAASGALFGSPGHMAPEQLRPGPVTPAADVFAVAVLLVEAWTGRAPFRRDSFAASADALRAPLPPLGQAAPQLEGLEALIASALAFAPRERPQTAEELARPLREFLRQDDLGDLARRLGERVSARLRRASDERASAGGVSITELSTADRGADSAALHTQTFAARPALLEWTAKIASVPPGPAPELLPGGLDALVAVGATAAAGQGGMPDAARRSSSIDSGVTAPSTRGLDSGFWARSRGGLSVGAALAVAAALLFGWGGRRWLSAPPAGPSARPPAAVTAGPASAPPTANPSAPLASPESTLALAAPPPIAPVAAAPATQVAASLETPAPPSRPARTPSPSPSSAEPRHATRAAAAHLELPASPAASPSVAPARLQLTAEPPAWVEVDAARVGRTPLAALPVTPGRHAIRFENPLLGERLEATVTLGPGGSARVHADFTSATPQVYVR